MKGLNMNKVTERYNDLMELLGYEHLTIGTRLSEDTDGWNLRDMVAEVEYILSTYYEDGHCNEELRHGGTEEKKVWKSHTEKMKRFIKAYEAEITDMVCTSGHCSKYDNYKAPVKTVEPEVKDQEGVIKFVSKKGTPYLLSITNGKIKAFTYEGGSIEPIGKKMYWSVTKEMQVFVASLS